MTDLHVDKVIKSYLLDFGLSEKEILVYISLLKSGPNTIMNIARMTKIKRSTCHNYVEDLIEKGLVSQTNFGERRLVVAESPDKLRFLIEQKKWDMQKLEQNLPEVIKSISSLIPGNNSKDVEVKYYIGKKETRYVYDLSLKSDEVHSFVNLDKYYEVYPNTENFFIKALNKNKNRRVYDITLDTPLARKISKSHERYSVKFLQNTNDTSKDYNEIFGGVDILIFDDKVAIIQLDLEKTLSVLINSKIIHDGLKNIHKVMWTLIP